MHDECLEFEVQLFEPSPTITFDDFWELYSHKFGKSKAMHLWNKLKPKDHLAIMESLPNYLAYIKVKNITQLNAETYLRGRRWEDEIDSPKIQEQLRQSEKNAGNIYMIFKNEPLDVRRKKVRAFLNEKVNQGHSKKVTDGFLEELTDVKKGEPIGQLDRYIGLEIQFEYYLKKIDNGGNW